MADKEKYKVVGSLEILGHPPGSVFEADPEDEVVRRRVEAGQLVKANANAKLQEGEQAQSAAAQADAAAFTPRTAAVAAQLGDPKASDPSAADLAPTEEGT